jgi:hypothetical protein
MRKMGFFFRRSSPALEPLPVAMAGVRAGERLLQIGLEDAALAAKVGLTGSAAFAVDAAHAEAARTIAGNAGVLAEVHVVDLASIRDWCVEESSMDVVVIHGRSGLLAALAPSARVAVLARCRQVLRPGGRLVAVEAAQPESWLARGPKPGAAHEASGGTMAALQSAGFKPVRVLAEREGCRFTEGARPPSGHRRPTSS